jgi:hypothetical protein
MDDGDVDGTDVTRVQAGLDALQSDERTDQHARAGQLHEQCGDLRHDENALAARARGNPWAPPLQMCNP